MGEVNLDALRGCITMRGGNSGAEGQRGGDLVIMGRTLTVEIGHDQSLVLQGGSGEGGGEIRIVITPEHEGPALFREINRQTGEAWDYNPATGVKTKVAA